MSLTNSRANALFLKIHFIYHMYMGWYTHLTPGSLYELKNYAEVEIPIKFSKAAHTSSHNLAQFYADYYRML